MSWDVRGWPLNHPGGVRSHAALAQNSIFNFKVHQSQCTWEQEPRGQTWGRENTKGEKSQVVYLSKTPAIKNRLGRCNYRFAVYLKSQGTGGSTKFGQFSSSISVILHFFGEKKKKLIGASRVNKQRTAQVMHNTQFPFISLSVLLLRSKSL